MSARKRWQDRYAELEAYHKKHGHCVVSLDDATSEKEASIVEELKVWVANQRTAYKNKTLSDEKISLLEDLGFVWTLRKRSVAKHDFNKMFEKLKAFYQKHGHSNVPRTHPDGCFAEWVATQRGRLKEGCSTIDERKALKTVEFNEAIFDNLWDTKFNRLLEYFNKTGYPGVPLDTEDHDIESWINIQRREYRENNMKTDRKAKLEAIGFSWKGDLNLRKWHSKFERLKAYKKTHGHVHVQKEDDEELYNWIVKHRTGMRKNLSKDQIKKLKSIGFVFKCLQPGRQSTKSSSKARAA